MPIYEYKCTSCGKCVEVIQKMSDAPLATCASCAGPLEKLLSRTSFHLSGGGWYSSGYSKGESAPAKTENAPKTGGTAESGDAKAPKKASACGTGCGCH